MGNVGIVGHRSWISRALMDEIRRSTNHTVVVIEKSQAARFHSEDYTAMFIVPGRLGQTADEMVEERELVYSIAGSLSTCKKQVLISSRSAIQHSSVYGEHKLEVEVQFLEAAAGRRGHYNQSFMQSIIVRPGAIFGIGQDINAPMLIPQLIRERGLTELMRPDEPTSFISIGYLTRFLVKLIDNEPPHYGPLTEIPGTFEATPQSIKDLFETFGGLA